MWQCLEPILLWLDAKDYPVLMRCFSGHVTGSAPKELVKDLFKDPIIGLLKGLVQPACERSTELMEIATPCRQAPEQRRVIDQTLRDQVHHFPFTLPGAEHAEQLRIE
jgi:hypothetical protein